MQLRYRGAALEGHLLGVEIEAEPADAYIRDNDLVVVYRETPDRPFSVQVYWSVSAAKPSGALMLDATVSIQTRQWEAYPRVTVTSMIERCATEVLDGGSIVVRPPGVDWSYGEATPPFDFVRRAAPDNAGDHPQIAWTFGGEFMERGVIRRLRLRGAFVPRAGDGEHLQRLRAALLAEQPPLTA